MRVVLNLYSVPTPLLNGADQSKIEDFFEATTKATIVDGKSFNAENEFDTAAHYGKKVFAHKVVKAKADTINFNGFRPLLDNLVSALKFHASPGP